VGQEHPQGRTEQPTQLVPNFQNIRNITADFTPTPSLDDDNLLCSFGNTRRAFLVTSETRQPSSFLRKPTVKMAPSNFPDVMKATQQDIEMLLAASVHLGSKNKNTHMESYIYKTRADGVAVLNVGKTW
jgi:hypothetical protein